MQLRHHPWQPLVTEWNQHPSAHNRLHSFGNAVAEHGIHGHGQPNIAEMRHGSASFLLAHWHPSIRRTVARMAETSGALVFQLERMYGNVLCCRLEYSVCAIVCTFVCG